MECMNSMQLMFQRSQMLIPSANAFLESLQHSQSFPTFEELCEEVVTALFCGYIFLSSKLELLIFSDYKRSVFIIVCILTHFCI
jgi:cellulose synthase/poly-beta-1,6-N-acetylglucosamine synthase-like glycosyltransferase